ncbi:MAG: hypothetical protein MUF09_11040 [Candidatus Nanopelagicales bacterium]|nr:hypothetical protein [Candidatus Nanopelagicales bacterium]
MCASTVPLTARVRVEVITVGMTARGRVGWSLAEEWAAGGRNPDAVARQIASGVGSPVLVHSTSWRWEPPDSLVLTYAAVIDGSAVDLVELEDPVIVTSGDPLRPRPDDLHDHHVVAHAVWHLATLAGRDPAITSLAGDPDHRRLFQAITAAAGQTPTSTYAQAHPGMGAAAGA